MPHFPLTQAICLLPTAWMWCLWTCKAERQEQRDLEAVVRRHALGIETSRPSPFSSCICNVPVSGKSEPVIIVTQRWSVETCETSCPDLCPRFHAQGSGGKCLAVHTEDGIAGGHNPRKKGPRPNIVDPTYQGEDEEAVPLMKMTKSESYIDENSFFACSCKQGNTTFLAGDKDFVGGLQVWGRTGCLNGATCPSACRELHANTPKCMLAAMTHKEFGEEVTDLGYATMPLTINLNKRSLDQSNVKKLLNKKILEIVNEDSESNIS